jgi:hypothetical protein
MFLFEGLLFNPFPRCVLWKAIWKTPCVVKATWWNAVYDHCCKSLPWRGVSGFLFVHFHTTTLKACNNHHTNVLIYVQFRRIGLFTALDTGPHRTYCLKQLISAAAFQEYIKTSSMPPITTGYLQRSPEEHLDHSPHVGCFGYSCCCYLQQLARGGKGKRKRSDALSCTVVACSFFEGY